MKLNTYLMIFFILVLFLFSVDCKGESSTTKLTKLRSSSFASSGRKSDPQKVDIDLCIKENNATKIFCTVYLKSGKDYSNEPDKLRNAINSFEEKFQNPNVNFLFEDFDKNLEEKEISGKKFKPKHCKNLVKNDTLFCKNVNENDRVYSGYVQLNHAWTNFQKKRKLYEPKQEPVIDRKLWDPYFDYPTDFHSAKNLKFLRVKNLLRCKWTIKRFILLYMNNKEGDEKRAKQFCEHYINFKRKYKTVGKVVEGLGHFLDNKKVVLEAFFDKNFTEVAHIPVKFKTIENCKKAVYQFKVGKVPSFQVYYCQNLLKSTKAKRPKAIHFEKRLNQSYRNFKKNNGSVVQSKYFDMTILEAQKLGNITFKTKEECIIDLPFLITILYNSSFNQEKVHVFCKNYVMFKRSYSNIGMLRKKLSSFTENYNKYNNLSFGEGWGNCSIDENKFFDYSNEEYRNMALGFIPSKSTSSPNCNLKPSVVINYLRKTAHMISPYGGKKMFTELQMQKSGQWWKFWKNNQKEYQRKKSKELKDMVVVLEKMNKLRNKTDEQLKMKLYNNTKKQRHCLSWLEKHEIIEHPFMREYDIRKLGIVNQNVYDQGSCGSCWAFAISGMLESRNALEIKRLKEPPSLSAQFLIDCIDDSKGGCDGGIVTDGLEFISKQGIFKESLYPKYSAKKEKCRTPNKKPEKFTFKKEDIRVHGKLNPFTLKFLLVGGPVVVNLDGLAPEFVFYNEGIIKEYKCLKSSHSVLLVGYGFDEQYKRPYWIIKNSWGPEWGMKGFAFIEMSPTWDACGMYEGAIAVKLGGGNSFL